MATSAYLLGDGDQRREVGHRFRGNFKLVTFERFGHDGQQHVEDARRPRYRRWRQVPEPFQQVTH